jgi:hypothetical protein
MPRNFTFIQGSRGVSSEEKAMYHQVLGAGRRGVIREFLGLTDQESADVQAQLEEELQKRFEE